MKKSKKTVNFKSDYKLDKKIFLEFWASLVFNKFAFILLVIINILVFLGLIILGKMLILNILFLIQFLGLAIFFLLFRILDGLEYQKLIKINSDLKFSVNIKNEKITIKNNDIKYNITLKEIKNIKLTNNLIVINLFSKMKVILPKLNIKGGTIQELITYLEDYAPNINVKKIKKNDNPVFRYFLGSLVFGVILIVFNYGNKDFLNDIRKELKSNGYNINDNFKNLNMYSISNDKNKYVGDIYKFNSNKEAIDYYEKNLERLEEDADSLECSRNNNYYKCYIKNNQDIIFIRKDKYVFIGYVKDNLKEVLEKINWQ